MEEENDFIKVVVEEDSTEFMEFPKEEDNTVLLSTLQAQYPSAIGLKYKGPSGAWRALSANDNVFKSPRGGWGDIVYCVTISDEKKRKAGGESNVHAIKKTRMTNILLQDMAVINLPFSTTESELKEYFEKNFGELHFCEIKKFPENGKSRGFGFVRFKVEEDAKNALEADHVIEGRRVELRGKQDKPMKLFIGRLKDNTTAEDLRDYFSQFGDVTDTYIPTPFKNFGFITFASKEIAQSVMAGTHYVNGSRVNIVERTPDRKASEQNADRSRGYSGGRSYGNNSYDSSNYSNDRYEQNTRSGYSTTSKPIQGEQKMDKDLKNLLIQCLQNS